MQITAKISKKGQVTIPKPVRDVLNTDIVEFEIDNTTVTLKPVKSVGGSLRKFAGDFVTIEEARDKTWRGVVNDRAGKKSS